MAKIVKPDIDALIVDHNYLVGKAWHMDVNDTTQGIEAQKWLFSIGFQWASLQTKIEKDRISLQSIWPDDIRDKTFTGGVDYGRGYGHWDAKSSLKILEEYGINELYVFTYNDIKEGGPDSHAMFDELYESENLIPFNDEDPIQIKYPQTGDYLLCHTDLVMVDDGIVEATKGQVYEIIDTTVNILYIKDNSGDDHSFDKRGEWSYTKWFNWIPREHAEEILNTNFFDSLNEEVKNPPTVGHKVYMIMHDSGKYVMSKNLTYGVYWVDIDDYGNREYDDYGMITFKKEGKAEEMLRLVNKTFAERNNLSGFKLNADYIDRYNPSEWQVIEYTLGLIPQQDLFENFKRDYDYTNIQFTLIQNGKPNGITYTITGRCKPDWISQTDPEGWVISWQDPMPDPYSFAQRPRHMESCIQVETIVRNFNDGTYVPLNLASSDEVSSLFDEIL